MSAIEIKWKIWWVPTLDNVAGNANRPGLPESTAKVCDRFCDEPSVAVSRRFKLEHKTGALHLMYKCLKTLQESGIVRRAERILWRS